MKRITLFVFITAMLFIGCTKTDKVLPGSLITKQVNRLMNDAASNQLYTVIQVGEYECNKDIDRYHLRQLESAGLITYDVTRYAWWEKQKKTEKRAYTVTHGYYYTWTETKYRDVFVDGYSFEDHYIVKVALTHKGEKLQMKSFPEAKERIDKDMIQPDIDESKYPWSSVTISENWPDIPNPFISPKEEHVSSKSTKSTQSKSTPKVYPVTRIDSLQYNAYNRLALSSVPVILKTGEKRAVKARNIQQMVGSVIKANADVIIETKKVTDAGRILQYLENGQKELFEVSLTYYLDKGWVLDPYEID